MARTWATGGRWPGSRRAARPDRETAPTSSTSSASWGPGAVAGVLVCPQGFVSDHLEVLYDLDVDARRVAGEMELAFARTASINDEAAVLSALAERVRQAS